jgi:hypothetical protein
MGVRDFVAGVLVQELVSRFAYPEAQCFDMPLVASPSKFHRGEVSAELRRLHECEIAYVTHQSQPPEELHREHLGRTRGQPRAAAVMEDLLPEIRRLVAEPVGERVSLLAALRAATDRAVRTRLGGDDPVASGEVFSGYTLPMADRLVRHDAVAWAAGIAERRGWRLHLYGKGWDRHPQLARYARGPLEHGESLRASYACAAVHLQASIYTAVHQRIFECALAGGLPLVRLTAEDLWVAEHEVSRAAAVRAWRERRTPVACHRTRKGYAGNVRYLFPALDTPECLHYLKLVDGLELPREAPGTDLVPSCDRMWDMAREGRTTGPDPVRRLDWLFDEPAGVMFANAAQLEARVARAVEDASWRRGRSDALAAKVREHLTHGAFAERVLAWIGSRLAG